jgi:hypothetical protein
MSFGFPTMELFTMDVLQDFQLTSVSGRIEQGAEAEFQATPVRMRSLLGPLALLPGTWKGYGFNQIWRPFHGSQDRFLELNETIETLQFDEIPGDIPNRGLLQADINLHGIRYLQQIQDAHVLGPNHKLAGIHIEPGLWLTTPATTDPSDPTTIARLANIPHGTSLVAQGSSSSTNSGPEIQPNGITPFTIGNPNNKIQFPESNLATPSQFRTAPGDIPNVTQAMVDNPNSVLTTAITGQTIIATTVLRVSTKPLNPPTTGGGTSNIAFLQGAAGGPNANTAEVDAIFWIEIVRETNGAIKHQLQYSQTVLLNFNGLSWPHVTVGTLVKQ